MLSPRPRPRLTPGILMVPMLATPTPTLASTTVTLDTTLDTPMLTTERGLYCHNISCQHFGGKRSVSSAKVKSAYFFFFHLLPIVPVIDQLFDRSADAEPEAKADPWVTYGAYGAYPYAYSGLHYGYAGYPYAYHYGKRLV